MSHTPSNTIPPAPSATALTAVPAPDHAPRSLILIVDDGAVYREPMEAVLRAEGFQTLAARDARETLAILKQHTPDLLLLDLALPDEDGLSILARVRRQEQFRTMPVIVLSGHSDRRRVVEAGRMGVAAYMLKTRFSLEQLLARIREQLLPRASAPAVPIDSTTAPPDNKAVALSPAAASTTSPDDGISALKSLRPLISRADLLDRIAKCGELKAFSPTISHILQVTGSTSASVDTVSKAISQDHAIALKILKLANSTVYTRGDPVDSVHKAVVRIGVHQIRQAVLNISVVEKFSAGQLEQHIDIAQFWEHAIACGLIAAELAHATDPSAADGAFTMGLIHDVGRVILAQELPTEYLTVLQTARRLRLPLEHVESRMILLNHADVMDRILQLWNFPKNLISPVLHHHLSPANVRSAAPHQVSDVLRLGLANRLAHALLLGSSGNETIYPTNELFAALKLDGAAMQQIETRAAGQTHEVKISMLSRSTTGAWPERRCQITQEIGVPLRPLFIGAEPTIDAYRIVCDQLRSPDAGPPNIAIVHLDSPRSRITLSDRLRQSEAQNGITDLPVIVLSPAAKLSLDGPAIAARRVLNLPSPVPVARFIEAIRALLVPGSATEAA